MDFLSRTMPQLPRKWDGVRAFQEQTVVVINRELWRTLAQPSPALICLTLAVWEITKKNTIFGTPRQPGRMLQTL